MAWETRILIDFATGDNWELPVELYEKYTLWVQKVKPLPNGETIIQDWLATLTEEEREMISKK